MASSIHLQFERFDEAHPEVYQEFCRRVDQLWNIGHRHYSSDGILHVLRFHSAVDGRDMEEWKINNNYAAFYARKYANEHPDRHAFFSYRLQKSSLPNRNL